MECILKIISEAYMPQRYFTDPDDGLFNCFDFLIVIFSLALLGSDHGSSIGTLRLLRLLRVLTFVKQVPALRIIIKGLLVGFKSVAQILILLLLLIYIFAVVGCLMFGANDPGRFGTIPMSMLTLFVVSTLGGWTDIAYAVRPLTNCNRPLPLYCQPFAFCILFP